MPGQAGGDFLGQGFIGGPGDTMGLARRIMAQWADIRPGDLSPDLYHWTERFDHEAANSAETTQAQIVRTSPPDVNPVFILIGNRIGSPLRPPAEGWGDLPRWLSANGWGLIALLGEVYDGKAFDRPDQPPAGMIPLSGTLFELFDALTTAGATDLRVYDVRALVNPATDTQQAEWAARFLSEFERNYTLSRPENMPAFDRMVGDDLRTLFGVSQLDPMKDEDLPGLEAVEHDSPLLFARAGTIRRLTARIVGDGQHPLTLVTGVSGVGKSSVLRAGLAGTWYRRSPQGIGHTNHLFTIVVEPDSLAPVPGTDPLVGLVRVLCGDPLPRTAGPFPALLENVSEPPHLTGDRKSDLVKAVQWFNDAVLAALDGPLVFIVDQAEQIDALARREAARRTQATGQEVAPVLDDTHWRFTALLAWLSGTLPGAWHDEQLLPPPATAKVVLGLHRLGAIDLWPMECDRQALAFQIGPIVAREEWRDLIDGTLRTYGLHPEEALIELMTAEAFRLAEQKPSVSPAIQAMSGHDTQSTVSVLPQVRMALLRVIQEWRQTLHAADSAPSDMHTLTVERYAPYASVVGSIAALGEQAISDWKPRYSASRRLDVESFDGKRALERDLDRLFGALMRGMIDSVDHARQDLSGLSLDSEAVRDAPELVQSLHACRLLTRLEGQLVRIPHRAIIDHWPRLADWQAGEAERLKAKADLKAFRRLGADLPQDRLGDMADLAINWIGPDEGEDRQLRNWLFEQLVAATEIAAIAPDASSPLLRLPFAALAARVDRLSLSYCHALIRSVANARQALFSFLIGAAEVGNSPLVSSLLDAGTNPNAVQEQRDTYPLLIASQNGHATVVEALLTAGADPNARYMQDGTFPLLQASQNGHVAVVEALLAAGADPNAENDKHGTFPLMMASQNGHVAVVEALVAAGAHPNARDMQDGTFPLLQASQNGHVAVVEALLAAGADPNARDKQNGTFPLLMASQKGHVAVVEALMAAGADPNAENTKNGTFPMLQASQNGHVAVVEALLAAGADPNARDKQNGTFPLLMASQEGRAAVVEVLLAAGADPNAENDKHGTFPLLLAARSGNARVVGLLIEGGADVEKAVPGTGYTTREIATAFGRNDVLAVLDTAGAMPLTAKQAQRVANAQTKPMPSAKPNPDSHQEAPPVFHLEFPGAFAADMDRRAIQQTFAAGGVQAESFMGLLDEPQIVALGTGQIRIAQLTFALRDNEHEPLPLRLTAIWRSEAKEPIIIQPGLDLDAVARSLPDVDFHFGETAKIWASLALLVNLPPAYALPDDKPLPFARSSLVGSAAGGDNWRRWEVLIRPEGRVIQLPCIIDKRLVIKRVLVPEIGLGVRIMEWEQQVAEGIEAQICRFAGNEEGPFLPMQILTPIAPENLVSDMQVPAEEIPDEMIEQLFSTPDFIKLLQQLYEFHGMDFSALPPAMQRFHARNMLKVTAEAAGDASSAVPLAMTEDELEDRVNAALTRSAPDWPMPPSLPGNWHHCAPDEASSLLRPLHQYRNAEGVPLAVGVGLCRVRTRPLACYSGAALVEALAQDPLGIVAFIRLGDDEVLLLTGQSAPIHRQNLLAGLVLADDEARADYLLLFMNWVHGEDGRFQPLVANAEFRHRLADAGSAAIVESKMIPRVTFERVVDRSHEELQSLPPEAELWKTVVPVFYGNSIQRSVMVIAENGMIAMLSDENLVADLPVVPELMQGPVLMLMPSSQAVNDEGKTD